uniref:Uncharacterized protein n=1 Tax=Rhizophora mucronata TaxID=61149 RepID=A0A2P2PT90_RHIMU
MLSQCSDSFVSRCQVDSMATLYFFHSVCLSLCLVKILLVMV